MIQFGSGVLWAIPTKTLAGVDVTAPTPIAFGALQDVTIDQASSVKELFGLYQDPIAVARGTRKTTGKAKFAHICAAAFNLLFGETPAAGDQKVAYQESLTIAANNGTVANNGTFLTDLGVIYAATGLPLARGENASAGVYSVANGVYAFNEADVANNAVLKASYLYGNNSEGQSFDINNQLLGEQNYFKIVLNQRFDGYQLTLVLNKCIGTKLSFGTKLEDYNIPEFDFSAQADDANKLGTYSFQKVA